jgi:hypothetical protein
MQRFCSSRLIWWLLSQIEGDFGQVGFLTNLAAAWVQFYESAFSSKWIADSLIAGRTPEKGLGQELEKKQGLRLEGWY